MLRGLFFIILLYQGCSLKKEPILKESNHHYKKQEDINISKQGSLLYYAYLKDGKELIRVSKKLTSVKEGNEVIRVYQRGYYPLYDIYKNGQSCNSKNSRNSKFFCNSFYTEKDSVGLDTSLNVLASLFGLTLSSGFEYHKVFSSSLFQEAILKSQLLLVKEAIERDFFTTLNIDTLKINIPFDLQRFMKIVSKSHKDIILVYDKNDNFKGVVRTYDLKEKELFDATGILAKRLMRTYIQQKEEFETREEFIHRVEESSSAKSYFIYLALQSLIGNLKLENLKYDADNQFMYALLKSDSHYEKKIKLKISRSEAFNFKNRKEYHFRLLFEYSKSRISLKKIEVDDYLAQENISSSYQIDEPNYALPDIPTKGFIDDLPTLLANIKSSPLDSKKWLFVIGVEKYDNTDEVKYSKRSAEIFAQVAQKTLGIIDRNSYKLIGNKATSGAIEDKLKLMLQNIKEGDSIYFYYSGHGIPVLPNRVPYLLPKDKIPDFIKQTSFFKLSNIYNLLSNSKAKQVIAIMDSCFSGSTDGKSLFTGVAGSVLIPKKVTFNHSKMVVLTAGRERQFSNMYQKRGHRLFSYFVMKALLNGKREVSDIYNELYPNVKSVSNGFGDLKQQEPTIEGNRDLSF